ncbi:MAG: prephenate dehydrogenase/arogenate dehydrogenase family protein [Actinobacteria bacterium]|nr:prephenate dehydrogenase/arogenate dehydrogenase family protein [Actinomycetota bacterium]
MSIPGGPPASTIGLAGYGRFGRALAGLADAAGMRLRGYDPAGGVPAAVTAADPARLAAGAEVIVVATPVAEIRRSLEELRPHLTPAHLVIDVGSVKRAPSADLEAVLGREIPWAATHPLFGPLNIARGDRPLRAVVCANPLHPDAVAGARRLYERLGCEVIEQTADEHDRVMARTHALAFFVAKGLIDIGAGDDLPFSPPSFQALAQTIDTVRADASHLFLAIERGNPHAEDARQALLDALARVHTGLDAPLDPAAPGSLTIPAAAAAAPELRETRDLIDEIDAEIVALLARRSLLSTRAGRIKSEAGAGIRDAARERELLDERRRWAAERGLGEETVADVFSAILRFSRAAQADAD